MTEFEALGVLLVRLLGLTLSVLALVQAVANIIDGLPGFPAASASFFFRSQLLRPAMLLIAGVSLLAGSRPLGAFLGAGLGL